MTKAIVTVFVRLSNHPTLAQPQNIEINWHKENNCNQQKKILKNKINFFCSFFGGLFLQKKKGIKKLVFSMSENKFHFINSIVLSMVNRIKPFL